MQRRHDARPVERPEMHVVDLANAADMGGEIACDAVPVEILGDAFEQDMRGFARQGPGAAEDQHRDQRRQERVDQHPAGGQDDQRRSDRRGRAEQIAHHVQDRAAHVEALAVAAVQHHEAGDVDQETERGDHQHRSAEHRPRRRKPLERLVDDPEADGEDGQPVGVGDHRLDPVEAIGEPCSRRRPARWKAYQARPSEIVSVSIWAASATSASDPVSHPPSASATMKPAVSTAAISTRRLRRCRPGPWSWPPWPWSCVMARRLRRSARSSSRRRFCSAVGAEIGRIEPCLDRLRAAPAIPCR